MALTQAESDRIEKLLVATTELKISVAHLLKSQEATEKQLQELKIEPRLLVLEHQVLVWEKWVMRIWALLGPIVAAFLGYYLKK